MRLPVVGLACAALFSAIFPALAGDEPSGIRFGRNAELMEARLGILSYDSGLLTTQDDTGVVINGEFLFPSPGFLEFIGSPRPYVGFDVAPMRDQIDFFYAGLNWEAYLTDRVYLLASLGGSVHNARNLASPTEYKALGCRALFHVGAGIGYDVARHVTVQLYADHFSNANLCPQNEGAEAAGVRFGYRF